MTRLRTLLAALLLATAVVGTGSARPASAACDGATLTASQLNGVFAAGDVGGPGAMAGYSGGDYQHVYRLPGGRQLWLFQDVFFSNDDDLRDSLTDAAHNAGLLQDGTCWSLVGGIHRNYLGHALTQPMSRWFWPLDGEMGADGKLWVFAAEMRNPQGTGAGPGTRPVATWLARIDPATLAVESFAPAPDAGTHLYGWSVASDRRWSYLYGNCYRQFVDGGSTGPEQFDERCSPKTFVARVPAGRFTVRPEYWTGNGWSRHASASRPVLTRDAANPMSVRKVGDTWVNVTKIDDWWGLTIDVDTAPTPVGPWETEQRIPVWMVGGGNRKCDQCGIYHAFQMRGLVGGKLLVATANGAPYELWYRDASLYRPTFRAIDVPQYDRARSLDGLQVVPRRGVVVLDTTESRDPLVLGESRRVPVRQVAAAGAVGVHIRLTLVGPRRPVQVRAWACGTRPPRRATAATEGGSGSVVVSAEVAMDGSGAVCLAASAQVHVRLRVTGSSVP